ncbi:MAG: hypothetical protein SFV55_24575 [Haliscomenobacter sp.]|uniref:pirin family protein n=1 Tax=Haliscomenobacter sp. TaxID=2717303 RepID=UPI0029B8D325|nr:hypothetical protein [Haliscomenobacter sp.]MDX2071629.1 hypothetical protein [Haliscomenobacter sp.]
MDRSPATIYLAEQRGITQADQSYRSWHTFNYGDYQNPHREAPGALRAFNEDTLAGGQRMVHQAAEAADIMLLPLVGGITVELYSGKPRRYVEAGTLLVVNLSEGEKYTVENPFEADLVSYLHVVVSRAIFKTGLELHTFDLRQHSNGMLKLAELDNGYQFLIGKFDGRAEYSQILDGPFKNSFIFIIDGVFEVQNRLLHARDGLLLTQMQEFDFEALAHNSIILLLNLS